MTDRQSISYDRPDLTLRAAYSMPLVRTRSSASVGAPISPLINTVGNFLAFSHSRNRCTSLRRLRWS